MQPYSLNPFGDTDAQSGEAWPATENRSMDNYALQDLEQVTFTGGTTGSNVITVPNSQASAFSLQDTAGNTYLTANSVSHGLELNKLTSATLTAASNQLVFQPSGAGNTVTITTATPASSRVYTLPDLASTTFAMIAGTQTLTNKTLSFPVVSKAISTDYSALYSSSYSTGTVSTIGSSTNVIGSGTTFTAAMRGGILLVTSGANSGTYAYVTEYSGATLLTLDRSVTIAAASSYIIYYNGVQMSASGYLSVQNQLYLPATSSQILLGSTNVMTVSATPTAARTITVPDATCTLVGKDTTDTLTNKTLTDPIISTISNNGTLTLPQGVRTLVGVDTYDDLLNKTLTSPIINTLSNNTGNYMVPCVAASFTTNGTIGATGFGADGLMGVYNSSTANGDYFDLSVGGGASLAVGTYLLFYNPVALGGGAFGLSTLRLKANGSGSYVDVRTNDDYRTGYPVTESVTNQVVPIVISTAGTANVRWVVTDGLNNVQGLAGGVNLVRMY